MVKDYRLRLILLVLAGSAMPLTWLMYMLSNRDPFIFGACLVLSMLFIPIALFASVIVLMRERSIVSRALAVTVTAIHIVLPLWWLSMD